MGEENWRKRTGGRELKESELTGRELEEGVGEKVGWGRGSQERRGGKRDVEEDGGG